MQTQRRHVQSPAHYFDEEVGVGDVQEHARRLHQHAGLRATAQQQRARWVEQPRHRVTPCDGCWRRGTLCCGTVCVTRAGFRPAARPAAHLEHVLCQVKCHGVVAALLVPHAPHARRHLDVKLARKPGRRVAWQAGRARVASQARALPGGHCWLLLLLWQHGRAGVACMHDACMPHTGAHMPCATHLCIARASRGLAFIGSDLNLSAARHAYTSRHQHSPPPSANTTGVPAAIT